MWIVKTSYTRTPSRISVAHFLNKKCMYLQLMYMTKTERKRARKNETNFFFRRCFLININNSQILFRHAQNEKEKEQYKVFDTKTISQKEWGRRKKNTFVTLYFWAALMHVFCAWTTGRMQRKENCIYCTQHTYT